MSFDPEVLKRLDELCELYKQRWGKAVDYIGRPGHLCMENMVIILERIVDTGESVLVGYEKTILESGKGSHN